MTPCQCGHEAVDHYEGHTRCLIGRCPCWVFTTGSDGTK